MKIKYEILDLTKNPNDLRAGDMVKLKKGLRVGKRYDGYCFYPRMKFRGYKTIKDVLLSVEIELSTDHVLCGWYFPKAMLDLTCVKRPIKIERLN